MTKTEREPPSRLYKYYAFNKWTQDIFERNEIYFQSPDCFNDPFDTKISVKYDGTHEQRIARLVDLWHKNGAINAKEQDLCLKAAEVVKNNLDVYAILNQMEIVEGQRRKVGIFCMTENKDNILMWSHYAAHHTGFCLEFKTDSPFFFTALPIDYSAVRPRINLRERSDPEEMVDAWLSKAIDWQYEKEWRIVDHENGPGKQNYPPESLSGVILGCRISHINSERIYLWCHARNPRPALYWTKEKGKEFGLDLIPFYSNQLDGG